MKTILGPCLFVLAASVACAAPVPAGDISHEAAYTDFQLSPDGKVLAYAEAINGRLRIFMLDLSTKQKKWLDLGIHSWRARQLSYSFWVNNQRLMYFDLNQLSFTAIDRNGHGALTNIPGGLLLHRFQDTSGRVLMTGYDYWTGRDNAGSDEPTDRPYVREINPTQGPGMSVGLNPKSGWSPAMRVVENPGDVVDWVVTAKGQVRAAKAIKEGIFRTLYRASDDANWGYLSQLGPTDPASFPVGFSDDGTTLYVSRLTPEGTWGIYPYDLAAGSLGEPLAAHAKFDIMNPQDLGEANGVVQSELIYSPLEHKLLGIRYLTDYPRVLWFDQNFNAVQAMLDQTLPKHVNSIVSMSNDLQQLIVLSWSASDPGTYYHFDRATVQLEKLISAMPWIDSTAMAETIAVRCKSRDGALIYGYICLPPGRGQTNLPLVALFNNEVTGRFTWNFNPLAQFLASRGYAVLQLNVRGSVGYGKKYQSVPHGQGVQTAVADCADGVRWAIKQKIADPARIAVFGLGELAGCYANLSLAVEPDLYRCGISGDGIADWKDFFEVEKPSDRYRIWTERFGDPADSKAQSAFANISPKHQAARIKAPLLVIQRERNNAKLYAQNEALVTAIKAARGAAESDVSCNDLKGFERLAHLMDLTQAFLARHMPANP